MKLSNKSTVEAVYHEVAERCVDILRRAIQDRGEATLVAAGGSTFLPVYHLLALHQVELEWSRVHVYLGDERQVPEDDPRSNSGMLKREFIDQFELGNKPHFYRIITEAGAEAAAGAYRLILPDHIDISLLGIGLDGHSASLFPEARSRWGESTVITSEAGQAPFVTRITLTPEAFNCSEYIFAVAVGKEKNEIASRIIADRANQYPLNLMRPRRDEVMLYTSSLDDNS